MGACSSVMRKVAFEEEKDTEELSPEARARKQAFEVARRHHLHLPAEPACSGFFTFPHCTRRRGGRPTTEARRRAHHNGPTQRRKVASRAEHYLVQCRSSGLVGQTDVRLSRMTDVSGIGGACAAAVIHKDLPVVRWATETLTCWG